MTGWLAVALAVAAWLACAIALLVVRARLGRDPRPPLAPRPSRRQSWPVGPFHSYRDIEFFLTWAPDRPTTGRRQLLTRLSAAMLAERQGIDLRRDPDAARSALGERAWALLDPHQNTSATRADIASLVDRLEQL